MGISNNSGVISKMEPEVESVVFKGYKTGLTLKIPENESFENCLQELKEQLERSKDFFKGAKVSIQTGKRVLSEAETQSITGLLTDYGLIFQANSVEVLPVKRSSKKTQVVDDEFIPTITVKKTVRSGQRIAFEGNLLIIGDVNPGAEVIASGDIVVLGKLRGTAHAGANGAESARIIAFQLKPVQIRIAGLFTRDASRETKSRVTGPEIASIRDGQIMVEPYKG